MAGDPGGISDVTADGSPVAVYLALPAGDEPQLIHDAVGPGASILELGCGAGRVTRPLAAMGHPMVAVDNSPAMLEHVTVGETVCADITQLDLGRVFDAVLIASHLVNHGDRSWARALLATARRHVGNDGVVLAERWNPAWMASVTVVHRYREGGPVSASFRVIDRRGRELDAEVTYRLGERSWTTGPFTAAVVDDDDLAQYATASDLVLDGWLDEDRTWARLPRQLANRILSAVSRSDRMPSAFRIRKIGWSTSPSRQVTHQELDQVPDPWRGPSVELPDGGFDRFGTIRW